MPPALRLHYFELPGRAETTRIMLDYSGIPYENVLIDKDAWPTIKPTMPFGQIPVLEVDGKMLAQSSAIDRYVAKLAGLMPTDPWEAAKVDELAALMQEIGNEIFDLRIMKDPAERTTLCQELCTGPVKAKLEKLASLLEANGGEFFVGTTLTWGDLSVYNLTSTLVSGFFEDVPDTFLNDYPLLMKHHDRTALLPRVLARYDTVSEGLRLAYKPLWQG